MPVDFLYTIGYSTHPFAHFLSLLKCRQVAVVADVRSHPYSRLEDYRRADLDAHLRRHGIEYVFFGRELGARRAEPECYLEGQAVYDRVAELPLFRSGIERLQRLASQRVTTIMCAEKEPLDCHRTVLVARRLAAAGWTVQHILAAGELESHAQTERRLVARMGVDPLFDSQLSEAALVKRAYAERGRQIAYRRDARRRDESDD